MAIEANFGWLNDYTGSRFAPFTFANQVLMDTSSGTTETLYEYSRKKFDDIKDTLTSQNNKSLEYDYIFSRILHLNPVDRDNNPLSPLAAQRAIKLVVADSTGNSETGLTKGELSKPIYFLEGFPTECFPGTHSTVEYTFDNKFTGIQGTTQNWVIGTLLDKTQMALDANISGVAEGAIRANEASKSNYAEYSDQAFESVKAESLAYNIKFGEKLDTDTNSLVSSGDLEGVISTATRQNGGELNCGEINLKKIIANMDKDTTFGGSVELTDSDKIVAQSDYVSISKMYFPEFTVDPKGRITDIKQYKLKFDIAPVNIIEATNAEIQAAGLQNATQASVIAHVAGEAYISTGTTTNSIYIDWSSGRASPVLMGAAWNDYAEFRAQEEQIEPGYCVASTNSGKVRKTTERLSICDGIVSDTYGFSIGKSEKYQTPLAVSGRVLAFCEGNPEDYNAGDVVCASANGKVSKMTRTEITKWPDRIVGTVSEIPEYEEWNGKKTKGRIWIKVK